MLPPFAAKGLLPPGVHRASWREFVRRFGVTPRRKWLLVGLRAALRALRAAQCGTVFIDGSFVTAKRNPADYDACWSVEGVDPALLDPVLLTFDFGRAAQKAKYRGELFPAQLEEGISGKTFLEFFQVDKVTGKAKGIVELNLKRWRA